MYQYIQHVCPNCGYCPHCGRGGPRPYVLPWVQPLPWVPPPRPWWEDREYRVTCGPVEQARAVLQ